MMMTMKHVLAVAVLAAICVVGSVQADTLDRISVETSAGKVAEYTKITDWNPPTWNYRVLYKHAVGDLLVYRLVSQVDTANKEVVTALQTLESLTEPGNTLSIDCTDTTCVATIGAGSVTFGAHDDTLTPPVRASAETLFAALPSGFQDELTRLKDLGTSVDPEFHSIGRALEMMFFSAPEVSIMNDLASVQSSITNFDPAVHAPTAFELLFGQAYYE